MRREGRKHLRAGLLSGERFLSHIRAAHDRGGIEESFAVERSGNTFAGLLQERFFLFGEGRALFPADDEVPVNPIQVAQGNTQQGFGTRRDQSQADGASAVLILAGRGQRGGLS